MNFFGFHFCADELRVLLVSLPVVGCLVCWLKAKIKSHKHKCKHK